MLIVIPSSLSFLSLSLLSLLYLAHPSLLEVALLWAPAQHKPSEPTLIYQNILQHIIFFVDNYVILKWRHLSREVLRDQHWRQDRLIHLVFIIVITIISIVIAIIIILIVVEVVLPN